MSLLEKTGPVKFAAITSDGSADLDVVAAVANKAIRVLSCFATITTAAGTVKFQSVLENDPDPDDITDLSGAMGFAARGQLSLPFNPCGWVETLVGERLTLDLNATGQISGMLVYQEVVPG